MKQESSLFRAGSVKVYTIYAIVLFGAVSSLGRSEVGLGRGGQAEGFGEMGA